MAYSSIPLFLSRNSAHPGYSDAIPSQPLAFRLQFSHHFSKVINKHSTLSYLATSHKLSGRRRMLCWNQCGSRHFRGPSRACSSDLQNFVVSMGVDTSMMDQDGNACFVAGKRRDERRRLWASHLYYLNKVRQFPSHILYTLLASMTYFVLVFVNSYTKLWFQYINNMRSWY